MTRVACMFLMAMTAACGSEPEDGDASGETKPATHDGCELTLSGAISASKPCHIYWHQIVDPDTDEPRYEPYFGTTASDGTFVFDLNDLDPAVGTYESGGDLKARGQVRTESSQVDPMWGVSENMAEGGETDVDGSYSVTITGITDIGKGSSNSVHFWEIDGTFDATYTPWPETSAVGDVNVHIAF